MGGSAWRKATILIERATPPEEVTDLINASIPAFNAEIALRRKVYARRGAA